MKGYITTIILFFKKQNKSLIRLFFLFVVITIGYYVVTPVTYYKIGNIFFGGSEPLYNVNLAQYFYKYASYPLVGSAPEFAHYQLSRTYFIKGFFKLSVEEALKEIELYPENKRTYYILGLTYGYMNREKEAIEAFSKFIEANPASWAARNDKAWLQFRVGDIEGALVTIEPVSQNLNPWVQNTYGTILLNLGRKEEAEQAFLAASANAELISGEEWGAAYPGNDPRIYQTGIENMKNSIKSNQDLLDKQ